VSTACHWIKCCLKFPDRSWHIDSGQRFLCIPDQGQLVTESNAVLLVSYQVLKRSWYTDFNYRWLCLPGQDIRLTEGETDQHKMLSPPRHLVLRSVFAQLDLYFAFLMEHVELVMRLITVLYLHILIIRIHFRKLISLKRALKFIETESEILNSRIAFINPFVIISSEL
jgi:hypothetical protein